MEKEKLRGIIKRLIGEIEEEDIGISLLQTYHMDHEDLGFFSDPDRERVIKILKKLADDSKEHKEILGQLIEAFTEKLNEEH